MNLSRVILQVQEQIKWKPGSANRHLLKRKLRGHLANEATLLDYEALIQIIIQSSEAVVYLYWYNETAYPTIVHEVNGQTWLVMFSLNGIMETAFVVENPTAYLSPPQFERIGLLSEVLHEDR